jgi:hypothetical protein
VTDILYIPKLEANLLLARRIYEKDFKILFDITKLYFKRKTNSKKKDYSNIPNKRGICYYKYYI